MELVAALAAGVRGAENGTAKIYKRATSTRAVYYSDFEGTIHSTSGADLILDANGSSIVYVNELCDIRIVNSSGTEVRFFVEGESAPAIEVVSNAFTGTDYDTSASAVDKPTNLQSVLDLWRTTNGAPDWKVLFGGSSISIKDAVAGVANIFFNVKSYAYGAIGDGTTDDTNSIQNTIAAAAIVKGIVIFPAGTYRITAKLTVPSGVSLWGVSPIGTQILMGHATSDLLEFTAADGIYQEVRNLLIGLSQANSGKMISLPSGVPYVAFCNCVVSANLHTGDVSVQATQSRLNLERCIFQIGTSGGVNADNANAVLNVVDSIFLTGTAAYNGTLVILRTGLITGSTFSAAQSSSGTYTCISLSPTAKVNVVGNVFTPGGGTSSALSMASNTADTAVYESSNRIDSGFTLTWGGFNMGTNNPQIQMVTRESRIRNVSSNANPLALQGDLFGVVVVTRTAAGAQAFTSTVGPPGALLTVVVYNNIGGGTPLGANPTFSTGFYIGTPAMTAPADTKISIQQFRAVYAAGTGAWTPVAAAITNI